jgi:hypothetical protein
MGVLELRHLRLCRDCTGPVLGLLGLCAPLVLGHVVGPIRVRVRLGYVAPPVVVCRPWVQSLPLPYICNP